MRMPRGRRSMSMTTRDVSGVFAASFRKTSSAVLSAHPISWRRWSTVRLLTGLPAGQWCCQAARSCRLRWWRRMRSGCSSGTGGWTWMRSPLPNGRSICRSSCARFLWNPACARIRLPWSCPRNCGKSSKLRGKSARRTCRPGFDLTSLQKAQAAYQGRPLRRVLDVLAEDAGQHAVVLGDPGAGKSTLARYLALSLLEADPDSRIGILQGYLPLLVELRTYARVRAEGRAETFVEFLAYLAEAEGYPFSAGQLEAFLQSGSRALVIFDGLDELFDPADREMAAERIAGFAARYPATRILVTSRIVGYRRGILTNSGFEHYTLQDLSDKQIGDFLATWYGLAFHGRGQDAGERRQRLLKAMTDSRSIRELAGNPMLLTILAI